MAWRNIWRHKRRTLIVVLAIGLTMAMMMFYDGLINGFQQNINANAVKVMGGNIQIHDADYPNHKNSLLPVIDDQSLITAAESMSQVIAASRRINTGGMASNREGGFPVSIIGVEPEKESAVSLIAQNVSTGRYLAGDDLDMVYIGQGLADAMALNVGDRFTLTGRGTHQQMRTRSMTVAGIYDIGLTDLEKSNVYMSLAEAQDLYGLTGQSTEVVVTLHRIDQEAATISALKSQFRTGYDIGSWQDNYPEMATTLTSKSAVMDIFSVVILGIAGIGILNMMMMAVLERTREIGVMGAIGLKPRQISWLFLLEGAIMGLVGLVAGVGLGLAFNLLMQVVGMDFSMYSTAADYMALLSGRIYPTLGLEKLPLRVLTVLVISLMASFSPAREASRKEPATALHYV
jgi:ABC-type lipoprotein release transport system permease subunit